MELSIKECPACGAVVMGGETICSGCGKLLPVATSDRRQTAAGRSSANEMTCPGCGVKVPRGVLRCRDCGTYMNADVEAAALAQQAGRAFTPGGSSGGLVGGGAGFGSTAYRFPSDSPATSNFAEVADDADFDLVPDVNLVDLKMRDIDEDRAKFQERHLGGAVADDDFEMGDGTGAAEYAIAGDSTAAAPETAATAAGSLTETAAPPESAESPAASGAAAPAEREALPVPAVAHSVETGGDVLLDAALAEQQEAAKRSKLGRRRLRRTAVTAATGDRFLIFCPNGHRIQVLERHRGRTGRCPNCRALFFVPVADTNQTLGQAGGEVATATGEAAGQSPGAPPAPAGYSRWITDVRLHRVNPAKLKLKSGSLEAEYESVDLGTCPEHLLVAVVYSGSGPFRAMQEPKKKAVTRKAMLDYLAANHPLPDLPVPKKYPLTPDLLAQLKIVQPAVPGEESLFADIPVFGQGRIGLRLPAADSAGERAYLSFTLSQFRQLSQVLSEAFGLAEYGAGTSIPLIDTTTESKCHYSDAVLNSLATDKLEYYKADPAIKLIVLGRRCEKCGLVVSEDSRKKEKIGGASDASVAKARCPKCKSKFGNITLHGVTPPG
jgi:hypothetical protein